MASADTPTATLPAGHGREVGGSSTMALAPAGRPGSRPCTRRARRAAAGAVAAVDGGPDGHQARTSPSRTARSTRVGQSFGTYVAGRRRSQPSSAAACPWSTTVVVASSRPRQSRSAPAAERGDGGRRDPAGAPLAPAMSSASVTITPVEARARRAAGRRGPAAEGGRLVGSSGGHQDVRGHDGFGAGLDGGRGTAPARGRAARRAARRPSAGRGASRRRVAVAGEVLGAGRDAGGLQARDRRRRRAGATSSGSAPKLRTPMTGLSRVGVDVGDRRQVEVDADGGAARRRPSAATAAGERRGRRRAPSAALPGYGLPVA